MKNCRNCLEKKASKHIKNASVYKIATEYGLAQVISPPKIIVCNDEIMLQLLIKNHRKTKKLNQQVSKIKKQIKSFRKSFYQKQQRKHTEQSRIQQVYFGSQVQKYSIEKKKSRLSSLSSSKNRQIGRFTRVSQCQSLSMKQLVNDHNYQLVNKALPQMKALSQNNIEQRSQLASFSKQNKNPQRKKATQQNENQQQNQNKTKQQNKKCMRLMGESVEKRKEKQKKVSKIKQQINQVKDNKNSAQIQNEQEDFELYLPSSKSVSHNLPTSREDDEYFSGSRSQKQRLQRQFEELIILQKKAKEQQKAIIRQQIKAITQMLGSIQN